MKKLTMEPIQYKLIPYPNQEGEWLIISNEPPKWGNYYISKFPDEEICFRKGTSDGRHSDCKIVIATSFLFRESIPLIRKEHVEKYLCGNENKYLLSINDIDKLIEIGHEATDCNYNGSGVQ
jgi:hypothetical protein